MGRTIVIATTRAYTIKLSGPADAEQDSDWRERLWKTHVTANRGVQVWGDWLLTLRGGLPASVIDDPELLPVTDSLVKDALKEAGLSGKEAKQAEAVFRANLEADRVETLRTLLALSWLSVEAAEDQNAINERFIVARASDTTEVRIANVLARFDQILQRKGIPEADRDAWRAACSPALSARIRDDAVWVDGVGYFNDLVQQCNGELTEEWAADTFLNLIGGVTEYFSFNDGDAAADGKDFVKKAGNWLSWNWGSGKKNDKAAIVEALTKLRGVEVEDLLSKSGHEALSHFAGVLGGKTGCTSEHETLLELKRAVGWRTGAESTGAKALAELLQCDSFSQDQWDRINDKLHSEIRKKTKELDGLLPRQDWMSGFRASVEQRIGLPFRPRVDITNEYSVLLDHALRRTSVAHSWIKRAEAERRRFRTAARGLEELKRTHATAVTWLDDYCTKRGADSGSLGEFFIRKSALDGWETVVKAWSAKGCRSEADRVDAVRHLQAELDSNDKWGDSRLFEDLAVEEAKSVWHDDDGKPSAQPLKKYMEAVTARHNQSRFKVPAYRHPHPIMHPVWVDFGNSRWSISYSALKETQQREQLRKRLASAKTDKSKQKATEQLAAKPELQDVSLSLWCGNAMQSTELRWQGKRLFQDLNLGQFGEKGPEAVRADRLGRAAAGQAQTAVNVRGVFGQKDWNGRLQLKRPILERLGRCIGDGQSLDDPTTWNDRARRLWQRLDWYLTTSAKLEPAGPFLEYLKRELPDGWKYNAKGAFLNCESNKADKRTGRTRIQLARLPNLRLLSLDMGHRYGAACAVWETLSSAQMRQECQAAGSDIPGSEDLAWVLPPLDSKAPEAARGEHVRRVIYRRLAPDTLGDGTPHPAPWARLDRQFLIRLQGEDGPVRPAHQDEFDAYNAFRTSPGRDAENGVDQNGKPKLPPITYVTNEAVREARFGLRRLSDRARIAHAMTANSKPISGGRTVSLDETGRRKYVTDALVLWHGLATSGCATAKALWDEWIAKRLAGVAAEPEESTDSNTTRQQRKKKTEELRERLAPVAEQLVDADSAACRQLHDLWAANWQEQEAEWKQHLRWLRRLIMPRPGKRPAKDDPQALTEWKQNLKRLRNVGGLSYDRLRAFRQLYQVLKAFKMRPTPDNLRRNVPDPGDHSLAKFGKRILNQFEKLREQRIKQLASRIVEAALGVGRENPSGESGRGQKRRRTVIDDPRFRPCHAVVVENLKHYRPEKSRLRRENRQLAAWSAANVRKYIAEGCELHGLYFDEATAAYTSKQDSRTGMLGVRCSDVAKDVLLAALPETGGESPNNELRADLQRKRPSIGFWRRQFAAAEKAVNKTTKSTGSARDRLLCGLAERLRCDPDGLPENILLPINGGELFLSTAASQEQGKRPATVQADLNAAGNVGLVALTDPDFPAAWWRVKVKPNTGATVKSDYSGSPLFEESLELLSEDQRGGQRDYQNAFRTPSVKWPDLGQWRNQAAFWNGIEVQCCRALAKSYGLSPD